MRMALGPSLWLPGLRRGDQSFVKTRAIYSLCNAVGRQGHPSIRRNDFRGNQGEAVPC